MTTDQKSNPKKKGSRFERARVTRLAVVQAIFQMTYNKSQPQEVVNEFMTYSLDQQDYPFNPDRDMFLKIMTVVQERHDELSGLLDQSIREGWTRERLDPVLAATLMAAMAELLLKEPSPAAPVIISEYVDITKGFFEGQEPSYVNKVLDQFAQRLGLPLKKG